MQVGSQVKWKGRRGIVLANASQRTPGDFLGEGLTYIPMARVYLYAKDDKHAEVRVVFVNELEIDANEETEGVPPQR